jgi:hypothetical protein
VNRSDLEIGVGDGAEGAFGLAQALAGPHDIAGSERGFVFEIGADDLEAHQGMENVFIHSTSLPVYKLLRHC